MVPESGGNPSAIGLLLDQGIEVAEPVQSSDGLAHAWVRGQPLPVAVQEGPVTGGEGAGIVADSSRLSAS